MTAIEVLPWDSRLFGRRIARLKSARLTPALAQSAIAACLKRRVRCLYFLASSDDSATAVCAQAHRFRLVDIRVTLTKKLGDDSMIPFAADPAARYRPARPSDIRPLQRMARTMFSESRFAADPGFPPDAHQKLFAAWIAKSIRGRYDDWVGVAECRGRPAGFVSCRRLGRHSGAIGLIGVARPFRRRGIGLVLLEQAYTWFRAHGIRHISIATQGRAIAAQRLYQRSGFLTSQIDLWFHKWF